MDFNISSKLVYFLITTAVVGEILSIIRFCLISKSQTIIGTSESWFGFYKDTSDHQWNAYYSNLPIILLFQIFCLFGSYTIKKYSSSKLKHLQYFNIIIGLIYSYVAMSYGIIFQFTLLTIFYIIQKLLIYNKYFVFIMWILIMSILYLNEILNGFKFEMFWQPLKILDEIQEKEQKIQWHRLFNMILLRIISFSFDHHWANKQQLKVIESKSNYTNLVKQSRPLNEYNFIAYLAYIYYTPLFITGPTITFNAFNAQLPQTIQNYTNAIKYVFRVYILNLLTFEIFLHICYPNAISNLKENIHIWQDFNFYDFHVMSFINLIFIWYKFMIIWRVSTAWALLDGIEVPENMTRCIYNNYNFSGFWRSWHRSFNLWLIRYLYIPLGGSKYKALNIWVVFLFVALWHDFKTDLIFWAFIICLALLPEMATIHFFNRPKYYKYWWFKYLTAIVAGFQIEMMSLANFIGFGQGKDCLTHIINQYYNWQCLIIFVLVAIFRNGSGVILALYVRQNEQRKLKID